MKYKHPNFHQFMNENSSGLSRIREIATDAIQLYNDLAGHNVAKTMDNILNSDEARGLLAECTINLLEKYKDKLSYNFMAKVDKCHRCGELAKINVYGSLKIGDRGKYEIYDDIKNHMIYDDVAQRPIFNLYNCVQLGMKLHGLKMQQFNLDSDRSGICIDVNATLVRYFNSEEYYKNESEFNNGLLATIFNRLVTYNVLIWDFERVLNEYVHFDDYPYLTNNHNIKTLPKTIDIRLIIKALMIYKIWYNIINGLDEAKFECSVSDMMDLIDENMSRLFNATQAVHDGFITMYNRLVVNKGDEMRHPDKYLWKLMNEYNKSVNLYFTTNVHRAQGAYHRNCGFQITVGVESIMGESFLRGMGVDSNIKRSVDSDKALFGFLGTESMQSNTKNFDEFRRKSRGEILAKLQPVERGIYMRLESDVLRLRSQAMAVNTVIGQQTALKRCEAVAKLIITEMNRSKSDEFIMLLSTLDSERLTVQTELANRDILKERNTRLYGQDITRNEWNY